MSYSIKIVDLDFYMGRPLQGLDVMYSEFRGTSITQVPILMLFGSTSTGEKICVHIHGVFPYLYIPYDGSENVNDLIYQIANNLDKAINISLNQAASNVQHIYKISLVSGIPMYGYHAKSHQFLKICLYNPLLIKKVSNLLKNSSALGRIYQPHETHLNFTLQFMIDYNLHGMSNMIASKIKFRSDPNRPNTTKNINPELFLSSSVLKISKCELEGDILAENIVNRQEISSGNINVNPGIATIWSDEMQRRRNKGETSQIDHPLELSRSAEPTKSHILFKQALSDRLAVLSDQTNVDNSNISVYPAETPRSTEIQNSSLIDCQTPTSNIESTMDKSENIESNDNSLKTISVSMDEDAFKLLDILNILEIREDRIEEDSILLQVIKNDDDDDNELDMSIPWQSCATSTKTVSVKLDTEDSDEDLNKTLIPQLDGGNDDVKVFSRISPRLQRETKYSETLIKKAFFVKIVKLDLDKDESSTSNFRTCNYTTILNNETTTQVGVKCPEKMPKTNIQTSRSNEERRKRKPLTLKQLEYRVKKLNYKNQVFTVMKKMHERERSILLLLNKTNKLAFNVTSSIELKEISKRTTEKMLRTHLPRIELEKENKKLCVSLDGTVDSSSSDEDESNEICKVSAQSTKNSTTPLSKIVSVKRQLDFYEEPLQSTFIEEKLTCSFSQAKVKIGLRKIKPVPTSEIKELSTKENDGHNFSSYHNNSKDKNKSFFNSQDFSPRTVDNLTVADKYDKDEEYTAKEGSSKLSMPDDKSARDTDAASNDIIDSIKFYQQIKEKESCSPPSDVSNQFKVIIKPCKSAISKIEAIKSLNTYNIPQVKYEEPFYSNVDDVTGRVEIGYNVLKIRNKSSVDLHDFDSQTDGLNVTRKSILESIPSEVPWKRSNINNIILASCKEKKCIVLPIRRPPTVVQVQDWLIKKCKKSVNETNITVKKNTIFVPCSHGSDDKDTSFSLSLTPSTPNTSHSIEKASETASNETLTSPVFDNKCKKRKLEVKQKKLSKSLLKLSSHSSRSTSQITGVTINNSYGFKNLTADFRDARAVKEYQYLTIMVMELHIVTRGDLKPDPAYDSIVAIFYAIFNDVPENCSNKPNKVKGVIVLNCVPLSTGDNQSSASEGLGQDCDMEYADTEENMLKQFIKLIDYWDPDIMAGYEIELLSWGYLIDRAYAIGMNLKPLLSRTSLNDKRRRKNDDDVSSKELKIEGRIMLNVWRLMRYEIALQSYTIESVVYHILHKRVPSYSFKDLTFWWNCRYNLYRRRVMDYYLLRIVVILELFDKLDFIGLTSELARLFGILFYEVLSRGSQFRVESMMLRLAKPLNFIPVSPSVEQRAQMKAPEYIPLILEPESKLYNDPVIVLDFQSLYPSIIIAYNYCFTTCIGRVELLGKNGPFEFGACQLKVPRRSLKNLLKKDRLNFSPCGVGFVKKKVRDGILPRMLREILDTRLMVKNVMKKNKDDPILEKVLHNRQLGLKLIANVTYGYTAANFSGRMPAVEVGDSVVSKGRETLQRAIELVDSTSEWGARVVYGDTDSLFVLVPGKTREQAFDIGKKIVDSVSLANPDPIKLKLEKIYHPCILQTKKRYVGYMYENVDQKEPVYDAKGIETVRRDGCPAVTKMLEKCLRMLFESKDVSLIKKYILRQFDKIVAGRVSIQDLTFAKEYRGASGYRPGACVPALELTRKWILSDKRNEPRNGERVPYIIVNGPPGLPLIRLVRSPRDLLNDPSLRPNTIYYITRVIIPPINRCFNLIGIDLLTWYSQMPRKHIKSLPGTVSPGKKSTISQYFSTSNCILCSEQTQTGICDRCTNQPQSTVTSLIEKLKSWEQNYENCVLICKSCTSFVDEIKCISLDCPVLYRRIQFSRDVQQIPYVRQLLTDQSLF